ncbi:unnamed protein product [Caenorhabditis angaria]|uniref:Uncharacterized protein n=1 Tax=Caenorhabditis angaria TaxID=860376 RepID=A0A9P1IFD4_9PELO|nr:unnamed protein product [Caenorhabditis angaria]
MSKILILLLCSLPTISAQSWLTESEARYIAHTLIHDSIDGTPTASNFRKIFTDPFKDHDTSKSIDVLVGEFKAKFQPSNNILFGDREIAESISDNFETRQAFVYQKMKIYSPQTLSTTFTSSKDEKLGKIDLEARVKCQNLDEKKYKIWHLQSDLSFIFGIYTGIYYKVQRVGRSLYLYELEKNCTKMNGVTVCNKIT